LRRIHSAGITRIYQANELALLNGVPTNTYDPLNAMQHAYTSATPQKDYGGIANGLARELGYALETDSTFRYRFLGGPDVRADSFKDLWNNAIGQHTADYSPKARRART
jgi:hypothetical protein